jgi:hypothetical protein
MKGNRRSFLASLFAVPAALFLPKPKSVITYMDTDSVFFQGDLTPGTFSQMEQRCIQRLYLNSIYGKVGGPWTSKNYSVFIGKELRS